MSDLTNTARSEAEFRAPTASDDVTRMLGAIWQRYAGERPSDISTVIRDDVVKCVIKDAVKSFNAGPEAEDGEAADESPSRNRYRHEAINAVSRATRRRVLAYIPDHDAGTDIATEKFILEGARVRN